MTPAHYIKNMQEFKDKNIILFNTTPEEGKNIIDSENKEITEWLAKIKKYEVKLTSEQKQIIPLITEEINLFQNEIKSLLDISSTNNEKINPKIFFLKPETAEQQFDIDASGIYFPTDHIIIIKYLSDWKKEGLENFLSITVHELLHSLSHRILQIYKNESGIPFVRTHRSGVAVHKLGKPSDCFGNLLNEAITDDLTIKICKDIVRKKQSFLMPLFKSIIENELMDEVEIGNGYFLEQVNALGFNIELPWTYYDIEEWKERKNIYCDDEREEEIKYNKYRRGLFHKNYPKFDYIISVLLNKKINISKAVEIYDQKLELEQKDSDYGYNRKVFYDFIEELSEKNTELGNKEYIKNLFYASYFGYLPFFRIGKLVAKNLGIEQYKKLLNY